MNTCEESVFDVINEHASNLEILGYNSDFAVEELNTKESQKTKGIQVLCTNDGGAVVPAGRIMPLIFKNHATLRDLSAVISPVTETELQKLYSTWPNFRLNNVKTLTTWMLLGIHEFLLQTIRYTTTLTNLSVLNVHNIDGLVNELLNLAPLSTFEIHHVNGTAGRASLVRLFEHYARVAEKTHSSLEFVVFRYCDPVSDNVLSTVTEIKTLHKSHYAV
ncbi:hypothetical protein INT45_012176 [Circinella minor]|uniref:Uncharacterized protein n=1 Tax=Circinella minor TaxID=1195481 RepID=A0A8H7S8N8_9FUNG|nr:hypothetical protein INT45_012176 [Circinella minor]